MSKILVVDDNPEIAHELKKFLAGRGFRVIQCFDGTEILNILKYGEYNGKIDLIILDFTMPGINGNIILEALKILGIDIPVIIMGSTVTLNLNHIPDSVFLLKPVDLNAMLSRVSEILKVSKVA